MKTNYALMTNDVETTSIWLNILRDKTGEKVLNEGMPLLLELYKKYNIKSTFFFTAYIAKLFPDVVKIIINDGHEVGSHGKSHLPENGFDIMPYEKQKEHLEYSKKLLEDISGHEVISFRSPALRVNENTAKALIETGYRIDSSIASQRFDFFLSFGGMQKLNWLFAPRLPYKVNEHNLFKSGKSSLIEVPLTATFLPYVSTTMRVFPWLTSMQRRLVNIESKFNGKPIVFDTHPNEFIDESNEVRIINKRSNNPINYFLKDWLRSQLKVKNLGKPGLELYRKEIEYFYKRNYKFTTIRAYCEDRELI